MCWIGRVFKLGYKLNMFREFESVYNFKIGRVSLSWRFDEFRLMGELKVLGNKVLK